MQRGRNRQRPGFAEKLPAWQVLGAGAAEPVRGPPSGQDAAGRASSPKPATAPGHRAKAHVERMDSSRCQRTASAAVAC